MVIEQIVEKVIGLEDMAGEQQKPSKEERDSQGDRFNESSVHESRFSARDE